MQEFDEAGNGRRAHFVVGERFRIRLKENRTSGYRWVLRGPLASPLELVGEDYEPAGFQPGAGGIHTWEIRCTEAGCASLEFGMGRPWDPGPPIRRFSVAAEVIER